MQTAIYWNEAQEVSKQQQINKEQAKIQHELNIEAAGADLYDKMGNPTFKYSDFEDICNDYDLDEEDLLFSMI